MKGNLSAKNVRPSKNGAVGRGSAHGGKSRKIIFLERVLKYLAVKALRRFKPRVVGITGSVGKTSTKEAIFTVLSSRFRVRKNEKNYNNEIGLPLTIFGYESGEGSPWKWAWIIAKSAGMAFLGSQKQYPEILVLEMGADRPGDIKYLVDFLKPEVGVLTAIGVSHLEYFKEKKNIAREKGYLVKNLQKGGLAVLNFDDEEISKIAREMGGNEKFSPEFKKITYGFSEEADMRASDVFFGYEKTKDNWGENITKIKGISFKISYEGTTMPVRLIHSVGRPQIYSSLAAAAIGTHFGMNLLESVSALKDFRAPAGRLNLIDGIKNSVIIEDSYNAAPQSTLAALEVLDKIQGKRKLVALGNMLELGDDTESGHREVGKKVSEIAELLFAVGDKAKFISDEARKNGMEEGSIFEFENSDEARLVVQGKLQEGDVILVKGSQGARMEKISEEIMRDPVEAEQLLPRQTKEWKSR